MVNHDVDAEHAKVENGGNMVDQVDKLFDGFQTQGPKMIIPLDVDEILKAEAFDKGLLLTVIGYRA